jgi:hypothetical protein
VHLRLVLGGVAALGLIGGGYAVGHRSALAEARSEAWKREALASRAAIARIERVTRATQVTMVELARRSTLIREHTATLIREVPAHVDAQSDSRFPMPTGLVRLHDAAALGLELSAVPDPAGRADGEASDVAASALASVIAENYGGCREDQARLVAWQSWADSQVEASR